MIFQQSFSITTQGRGTYEVTQHIHEAVNASRIDTGLCNIFMHHTSASLILCENADPTVRSDLETFMNKTVPDGDPSYQHRSEGPDDMPAHVRTVLTHTELNIPVTKGRCALGTWQGIYLWEHRTSAHHRQMTVTVYG